MTDDPAAEGSAADDRTPPSDAAPPPAAPQAGGAPRLTRDPRQKVVAGVCGGLGRYFGLDPVVFRVPVAVLAVAGGLGLIFYGFAWLLVPDEGRRESEGRRLVSGRVEAGALWALLAALAGCVLFLTSAGGQSAPFSLMLAGAVAGAAYWSRRRRAGGTSPHGPADSAARTAAEDAPPETQAPPVPTAVSWWKAPAAGEGYRWGPGEEPPPAPAPAGGRRPRRERRPIGGLVFLLALLAGAAGTAARWAAEPLAVSLATGLACALTVFVLGMVVGLFAGRTGIGTVLCAVMTAGLLAATSALPRDVGTRVEDRRWTPASAADVRPRYEIGTGRGMLDLRDVDLREGRSLRVEGRVGAGTLQVVVPDEAVLEVDLQVGAGGYRLPREEGKGTTGGGGLGTSVERTLEPAAGTDPAGTLELRLEAGLGELVVAREGEAGALPGLPPLPPSG